MVVGLEFNTCKFGDGGLFELLLREHLGLQVVELLEGRRGGALFAVILIVADEERPGDMPELSVTLLHYYKRRGKI